MVPGAAGAIFKESRRDEDEGTCKIVDVKHRIF
jgi:hypothetical protein